MVGLGIKISAEHFPDMKHGMSFSEIERTVIKLEELKSLMPINLNGHHAYQNIPGQNNREPIGQD